MLEDQPRLGLGWAACPVAEQREVRLEIRPPRRQGMENARPRGVTLRPESRNPCSSSRLTSSPRRGRKKRNDFPFRASVSTPASCAELHDTISVPSSSAFGFPNSLFSSRDHRGLQRGTHGGIAVTCPGGRRRQRGAWHAVAVPVAWPGRCCGCARFCGCRKVPRGSWVSQLGGGQRGRGEESLLMK